LSNSRDPLPLAILWRVFVLPQRLSPLTTEETLDRGRELADLEIPWISLGVSGAFNLYYMLRNDTDLVAMLTCTATDTFGRTVGGTTGKFAGAAAGTILFGPAGAIVIPAWRDRRSYGRKGSDRKEPRAGTIKYEAQLTYNIGYDGSWTFPLDCGRRRCGPRPLHHTRDHCG
jgi:hypothetical protein